MSEQKATRTVYQYANTIRSKFFFVILLKSNCYISCKYLTWYKNPRPNIEEFGFACHLKNLINEGSLNGDFIENLINKSVSLRLLRYSMIHFHKLNLGGRPQVGTKAPTIESSIQKLLTAIFVITKKNASKLIKMIIDTRKLIVIIIVRY